MKKTKLVDYFEKINKLEFAIYTHEKLKPIYFEKLQSQTPQKPTLQKCSFITKPVEPEKPVNNIGSPLLFSIPGVMAFLSGVIIEDTPAFVTFFGLVAIFVCLALAGNEYSKYSESKDNYEINFAKYKKDLMEYENKLISNKEKDEKYEKYYQEQIIEYNNNLIEIDTKVANIKKEFNLISLKLKASLTELYSENIIFPKYRNLIAISTILEYLSSGRCSELEGPNGAYNLYELELRQNIIINQLSSITRNLEQIKNNQYILYQELNNSNRIIIDMLNNIGNEISISNYYAQINTKALTSPKVSCGIIL